MTNFQSKEESAFGRRDNLPSSTSRDVSGAFKGGASFPSRIGETSRVVLQNREQSGSEDTNDFRATEASDPGGEAAYPLTFGETTAFGRETSRLLTTLRSERREPTGREGTNDCPLMNIRVPSTFKGGTDFPRKSPKARSPGASVAFPLRHRKDAKRQGGGAIDSKNHGFDLDIANRNKSENRTEVKGGGRRGQRRRDRYLEMSRMIDDNFWLISVNHELRMRLRHVRETTFSECAKILDAIMAYCDAKAKATGNRQVVAGEGRGSRVGVGCGGGLCGGYTPSGWNKLKLLGAMADQRDCLPDDTGCHDTGGVARSRPEARGADKSETRSASEGTSGERSCKFRPSVRLLGEMAFQLERRILDYVFGLEGSKKRRFYGYTVSNICYMMEKESTCPDGTSDSVGRSEMTCRLRKILCTLEKYGYDIKVHADFAQEVINKYGLLPCPPDKQTVAAFSLNDACTIACLISRLAKRQSEVHNLNILLNCLNFLSKCDGRPLFVW